MVIEAGGTREFVYHIEKCKLVDLHSKDDIAPALEIMKKLAELINLNDENRLRYKELSGEQLRRIRNYISRNEELDSSLLANNINFLVKRSGIKIGELEEILEISTGYISRTAREGTGKRLSIDAAWKVSRLFDVDLGLLVSKDLDSLQGNTTLVLKFLEKMTFMTKERKIEWQVAGGYNSPLADTLSDCGIVVEEDGACYYVDRYGAPDSRYPLADEIMVAPGLINGQEDLYIIPYSYYGEGDKRYDFITIPDKAKESAKAQIGETEWEKLFFQYDETDDAVVEAAKKLYGAITDAKYDVIVPTKYKSFIQGIADM